MTLSECNYYYNWDYSGWRKASSTSAPYTQKDWNNTLMTKINLVCTHEHQIFGIRPDTIEINSNLLPLFNCLGYFIDDKVSSCDVIINDNHDNNLIIIYDKSNLVGRHFTCIVIENLPTTIANVETDELFDMLPSFINVNGIIYSFNMIKSDDIQISYQTGPSGDEEYLSNTYRTGKTLNSACLSMVKWLLKFNFVQYMPYGYKEKYEKMFNTTIIHSRNFDK